PGLPVYDMEASTASALPELRRLADRAEPHDRAVYRLRLNLSDGRASRSQHRTCLKLNRQEVEEQFRVNPASCRFPFASLADKWVLYCTCHRGIHSTGCRQVNIFLQ